MSYHGPESRDPMPREPSMNDTVPTTPDELAALQARRLGETLARSWEQSPFLRAKLEAAGVRDPAQLTPADLPALPFTTKEELRDAYPFGWRAAPFEEIVRIHASSGTTGKRTVAYYTARDLAHWTAMFVRCYQLAGVTRADRVQITPGYGLWTAGIGFQTACEALGALAVPAGPGNTELQLELMLDLQTTVVCATSSFALLLGEEVAARGLREKLALRTAICGSERWGEGMRQRIGELLGVETYDIHGFTELYGPGMGLDCRRHEGIHYWADHFLIEVIDPDTGQALPPGELGELVVTTLTKEAMPLLRYRTRDLSRLLGACACGSVFPCHDRLLGRSDDMVKFRGVAVFPGQIDAALAGTPGVGSEYQIVLERQDGRDAMRLRVELAADLPTDSPERAALAADLAGRLKSLVGITPDLELLPPRSLPRSERKTRRVFDNRELS